MEGRAYDYYNVLCERKQSPLSIYSMVVDLFYNGNCRKKTISLFSWWLFGAFWLVVAGMALSSSLVGQVGRPREKCTSSTSTVVWWLSRNCNFYKNHREEKWLLFSKENFLLQFSSFEVWYSGECRNAHRVVMQIPEQLHRSQNFLLSLRKKIVCEATIE